MRKPLKLTLAVCLLCAVLACSLLLSGCNFLFNTQEAEKLCDEFVGYVIDNDKTKAYGMMKHFCTVQEFNVVWDPMRETLENSKTYTLERTGYRYQMENGEEYEYVFFELITDDEKICQLYLVMETDGTTIAGFHFLDSTTFAKDTAYFPYVNIALLVLSLAMLAFVIWMLVDCIRRNIKLKWLWILILLWSSSLTLLLGDEVFDIRFGINLLFPYNSLQAIRTQLAAQIRISLPFGAILYFILRKILPPKAPKTGFVPPYYGQPYQGQPYQGQPFQGQPYQGQPYQGQPFQGQPNAYAPPSQETPAQPTDTNQS